MNPSSNNNSFNNNYINYNNPILSPSSSSLYHIPSSPLHYEDELLLLQALILQQQQQSSQPPLEEDETNNLVCNKNNDNETPNNNVNPNKTGPKKDRHSKITTAHGLRDRRMRLSLDVAREFFDLQDTLGFDKASKTVDWLLTKSNSAIRELANSLGLHNTLSECEAYSSSSTRISKKEKSKKKARRARIFPALTKESRKKARERARERTMKKKKKKKLDEMGNNWSAINGGEESSGTNLQNKAGVFSRQVPVMEELSSQMGSRVNKEVSGTYQQNNGGIFSPEVELLSSQFHIHVNKQLSPFRDFPPETIW